MPGQGRLGDKAQVQSDAHGCPGCPHPGVGPAISGSPTVFVNGRPALRVDDAGIHAVCCGPNLWQALQGSATVFINGKAAFRKDDPSKHCGGQGKLIEGSDDVLVGDASGGGGGGGSGGGATSGGATSGGATSGGATSGGATSGGGGGAGASKPGPAASPAPAPAPAGPATTSTVASDEIEVTVVDAAGKPCKDLYYELTLPDGARRTGKTDGDGKLKLTALVQKGDCTLKLPDVDDKARR